jgi:hypothetical protein
MAKGGRKLCFGFSVKRDADGKPLGIVTIKLKHRNAYELLGLRKPLGQTPARA